jgi:hypothetical protein
MHRLVSTALCLPHTIHSKNTKTRHGAEATRRTTEATEYMTE